MAVGRPREFDPDQIEDTAMRLFWERGFDGVSISDVTAATGVNRRSVYAEFGSKEGLFARAAARYLAGPGDYITAALTRSTAREVAEAMLHGAADTVSGDIPGCLTVGEAPGLAALREATVQRLASRFEDPFGDGSVVLARWVIGVCQGIAVQARSGASRNELHAVADLALRGWPGGANGSVA